MAGLPYMTEEVAKATRTYYLMLSERDGAASKAALETLGADAWKDYKEFLLARRGQEFQDAFRTGAGYVDAKLHAKLTPEDADALRKAWAATYAKGASGSNFKVVEGAFVLKLGGLDREPADVRAAVDQL